MKSVYVGNSESLEQIVPVLTDERTLKKSYLDPDSMLLPWNPDDLVYKHNDYSIYEEMGKDDQVSVCLQLKADLILCSGFDFIPGEDGQDEIVDDLSVALREETEYPFEEMLEEMVTASAQFGNAISEKVFFQRQNGNLGLRFLKTRHPGPWKFHTDDHGNVIRYEQEGTRNTDVPKEALIHYINKRRFQNPYGTSDLRPAYQAWFTKKHITRWYAIFIEKSGSPVPVGKYDAGYADETAKDKLYQALKKFQTKSALVIPKEFEVDFLESTSNGEAFINGLNLFNMYIGRSLLIPDLLGFQGSETGGGSYALGEHQMEIFFKHIQRRREILERTINHEIVWPLVLHNFGMVDHYPKFKLRPITEKQIVESTKLWLDAVKSNVYVPSPEELNHFREIINFPIADESTDIGQGEEDTPGATGPDGETGHDAAMDAAPDVTVYPTKDGDDSTFTKKERKFGPTNGPYSGKTNFDLLEKTLDTSVDNFLAVSRQMVSDIFKDFEDQIDRKKIVQRGALDKLESLELKNTNTLRARLFKDLKDLYKKGGELASAEVFKGSFAKPILDEKFLEILESETFQFMGDWKQNITKRARALLIAAIKDGKPISSITGILQGEMLNRSRTDIERWARTKFTEVMNKGRLNFFNSTKVIAGYQYSAILDDRTTEICRGLHGKKFVAGTEPIPPNHWNCRSILVPITIYEEFTPDEKVGQTPIDAFIEEKLGRGFPKQ